MSSRWMIQSVLRSTHLRACLHACVLVTLLAGLLPPPLVSSLAPTAALAAQAVRWLPSPQTAQAAAAPLPAFQTEPNDVALREAEDVRASQLDRIAAAPATLATAPLAQASALGLGNRIWQDIDANGLQGAGEPGIAGVTVNLYDTLGVPVLCVQEQTRFYLDTGGGATDSWGDLDWSSQAWSFTSAGTTTGGNPGNTIYVNGNGSAARNVDLSAFGANPTLSYDYAYTSIATGDQHLVEYSANSGTNWTTLAFYTAGSTTGWQQASATLPSLSANSRIRIRGIAGTTGNALRIDNLRIEGGISTPAFSVTDSNGEYSFDSRCVQSSTTYQVGLALAQTPLVGLSLATANAGGVTSNDPTGDDSDSDAQSGTLAGVPAAVINATALVTDVNNSYDFGFAPVGIGNWLWQDTNGNGLQDNSESGLGGVQIGLYDTNNQPIQCIQTGAYDTYADQFNSGASNGSAGSLAWGTTWSFAGSAAAYSTAGNPGGSMYVYGVTTSTAVRSVDLSIFGNNPTLSFDYIRGNGTASYNIQYSSNGGTSFTTLETLTVNNTSYQTISYTLPITAANAQIRIQGDTGSGIYAYFDNVTIQGKIRSPVTTVTDVNGYYTFTGANCVQPNTTYQVRIDRMQTLLFGLALTTLHAGNVISDSDAISMTLDNIPYAMIPATSPATGINTGYDAGFVDMGLGNTIWRDNDIDGLQDANEPGIADVTVNLYNSNGTPVQCVQAQTRYYMDVGGGATDSAGDLNWAGQSWTFSGAGTTTGGSPGNTVYVYGNGLATRVVDLSGFGSYPIISYSYAYANTTTGYSHVVEYSTNSGVTWTALKTYDANGVTGWQYHDFTLPSLKNNVQIRIRGTAGTTGNYLRIDNLRIEGGVAIPATDITDGAGHYSFDRRCVQPNTAYQVRVDQQQASLRGLYLTTANGGGVTTNNPATDHTDSDATSTTISNTTFAVINLTSLATGVNDSLDFGFVESGIGNTIWKDNDTDGLQDNDEPGIANVTVSLYDTNGAPVQCVQNETDYYLITDGTAANSNGSLGWSQPWTFSGAGNTSGGNPGNTLYVNGNGSATRPVDLSVFGTYPTLSYDYAYYGTTTGYIHVVEYSTDSGATWTSLATYAANGDTTYQTASFTLPSLSANARIRIRGTAGTTGNYLLIDNLRIAGGIATPATSVTNSNGRYSFDGACVQPNGTYQVRIDTTQRPLKGLYLTAANAGGITNNHPISDTTDSDATSTTISNTVYAVIDATAPTAGINYSYDAGFVPVEIGNYLWKDSNANGLQDDGEPGLAGVTLGLYTAANAAVQCVQDETRYYLDSGGSAADNLGSLPWSQAWTFSSAGTRAGGNPGNTLYVYGNGSATRAVNLAVFGTNPVLSFDYAYLDTTTGYSHVLEYSTNGGATWNALATYSVITTGTTWQQARFTLPTLSATASIRIRGTAGTTSNYLRLDNLRIEGGIVTPATAVTDATGYYSFDGAHCVQPNTTYRVRIDMKQAALRGLNLTTRDAGDDTRDSDARSITSSNIPYALIDTVTAPAAGVNYTNDIGFAPVEIGDWVWQDNNVDGLQDPGEPGIPGVTLRLYDALGSRVQCVQGGTGAYLDQGGGQSDSKGTLDWSGQPWNFGSNAGTLTSGGNPGNALYVYGNGSAQRAVDLSPFAGTYPTLAYDYAYLNTTGDYYHTVEYSTNGTTWTTLVTYGAGSGTTWQQASFTLPVAIGTLQLRIRGTAGTTDNRLLIDNLRLEGAIATDATAVTDATGHYTFDGRCLQASTPTSSNNYQVRVDTTQAALTALYLTTPNANDPISDTLDSDATQDQNDGVIDFNAPIVGINTTYDMGFVPVEIGDKLWYDNDNDGSQDPDETGIAGVTISLYDANGAAVMCTQVGRYDSYRDDFTGGGNNGSTGTLNWGTSWSHSYTAVTNSSGNPGGSMYVYGATGYYATRAVNLSVFATPPTLRLDYNFQGYALVYNIQYSADGGNSFQSLATLSDNNNGYRTITYTVPITTANAQIRISGVSGSQYGYFDNITLQGQQRFPVTSVTDANGNYSFSGANCVRPNTTYQARIDTNQAALFGFVLTTPNAGGVTSNDPTADNSDSDAVGATLGGIPTAVITATAPAVGANHSYDAGFKPSPTGTLQVNTTVNGGTAPASWRFTIGSPNCLLPPDLTQPLATATGAGGTVTFANLLVTNGTGMACQYTISEQNQSGWFLNYGASDPLVNIGVTANTTTTVEVVNSAVQTCNVGNGNVGGTVFQDFNRDGQQNSSSTEPAFTAGGIIMRAYGPNNQLLGETSTQLDGTYVFANLANLTTAGARIEFQNLPDWLNPTVYRGGATTNRTSSGLVRFVNAATCNADLGVSDPVDYCQANPDMCTNVYINGDSNNATAPTGTVVKFGYNLSGRDGSNALSYRATPIASKMQVGSTWGLAYRRANKTVYESAFLKRHVGLGPGGLGAIYATDPNTGATTLFADLAALGANVGTVLSNSARGLTTPQAPNIDATTWDQVYKVGLGDIDLSEDESLLYVVSLNDKKLYALTMPAGTLAASYVIPDPGCVGGAWRPFGLKTYHGDVYVGGVCDAQSSQNAANMKAYVYRFTPDSATFSQVLSFSPPRPIPWGMGYTEVHSPILSDIEFDIDGSMVLGLSDRLADQVGWYNYYPDGRGGELTVAQGDLLRARYNNGTYSLVSGEFYNDSIVHDESAHGGLAFKVGSGETASTVIDPVSGHSGGVAWFDNATGQIRRSYEVYYAESVVYWGKANGIGDLELLCDQAPLEIGNRVWNDNANPNGVQDPGEPGIADIQVRLYDITGTVVATTTTDANGEYSFNSSNVPGGLKPNTDYTIRIDRTQTPLNGLNPTLLNQVLNNAADPDEHDSDGDPAPNPGDVTAAIRTGGAGQNDYSYDFGFRNTVQIGNRLWIESDSDGDATTGTVTPVVGQVVTATSSSGVVYTATTDTNGLYTITVPTNAVYTVTTGIPAGTTPSTVITTTATDANAAANNNKNHLHTGTTVTVGTQNNHSVDFGFHAPLAQFGDRAWIESDQDGLASTGTLTPVAGMVITATDGTQVYTTTTTAQGYYSFTVPAGTYTVTYGAVPSGYGVTVPSATPGGNSETGNAGTYEQSGNPDQSHANGTTVTLTDGQTNWHMDFAFHNLVQIGNQLWIESDNDGDATTGTVTPVAGQVVTATSSSGQVYTATTDVNGLYTITVPANAVYTVTTGTPAGTVPSTVFTSVADDSNAAANDNKNHLHTGTTVTVGSQNNHSVDFGFHAPLAQFGDRAWFESDQDGLASTGSITPIAGMVITATDGTQVYTTTTTAQGYYSFTVPVGTYTVTYGSVPSGYGVTVPSATPGGDTESGNAGTYQQSGNPDQSHANGTTVTLTDGQTNWHMDFAFHNLVQIGNQLWLESDNDGDATTGTVTPVAGQVVTATSSSGQVYTATTDVNGLYTITVPANAVYTVTTGTPAGTVPSTVFTSVADDSNAAANDNKNHLNTGTTVTVGTQNNHSVDFGFHAPLAQFGDRVWLESDQDGLANTGSITPIAGMVITATDGTQVYTTTTTAQGYYSFTVPVGTYTVTYGPVPSGYGVTVPSATPGGDTETGNAGTYQQGGNPDQSHVNGTKVTLTDGQANWHMDFAFHNLVHIGNQLWLESDNDGDATTGTVTPVVGQVVTATSSSGVVYTATTDVNGLYTITVPANAVYTITTGTPAGTVPSTVFTSVADDSNAAANDNKNHLHTGTTVTVGTQNNYSVDFGFHAPLAQFGDRAWIESDQDGLANTGSITPIAGMVITATDGTQVYTTTTTAQGYYSFTVPVGAYTVTYGAVPSGYGITVPSATPGGDTESGNAGVYAETSNPDQSHANGTTVTLTDGQTNWQVDFAFHNLVHIGNQLWLESDSDGDATTGTVTPIVGQVVTATSSSGQVYTATTDANGLYTITVPANAVYTVTTGTPAGTVPSTVFTSVADDSNAAANDNKNHLSTGTTVTVGTQNNHSVDFGFHAPLAQFGDRVWLESDQDGLASTGSITPIAGMVITATDGTQVYTTTTTVQGYYSFTVPAGTYTVTYGSVPSGYGITVPSATPSGNTESGNAGTYQQVGNPDQSHANGTTVTLTDGQANWHMDFAFHNLVHIGNQLWLESDSDGDATTGTVTPVVGQVVTATSSSGVVYTATTDVNGLYTITVPANAVYTVTTGTPAGTVPSTVFTSVADDSNAAANDNKNHLSTGTTVTVGTQNNYSVDFGFNTPVPPTATPTPTNTPTSTPTVTPTNTPTVTPTNTPTMTPTDTPTNTPTNTPTVTNTPTNTPTPVKLSVGNLVWNDLNNNGVVDIDEPGMSGVTVKLYSRHGATPLATTTTDANGKYLFAGLGEGAYFVEVNIPTYINSKGATRYYVSSDDTNRSSAYTPESRDNDDNGLYDANSPSIVRSTVVTLTADTEPSNEFDQDQPINGVVDTTAHANSNFYVDFGFYQPGVIRTAFWLDDNNDGIRQSNETSLAKFAVSIFRFYQYGMSRQAMELVPATDINGQIVPTQTVGTDGFAFFADLPPGEYVFQVTPPEGYILTQGGADPDDDNPNDSNGISVEGVIQSLPLTLIPGTEPIDDGDDAAGNQTVGFGFSALTGIGDRIWADTNSNGLQDAGEEGVAGVIINLYNAQGDLLATLTADALGNYRFQNLTPGQYYLSFMLPPGYGFTSINSGSDNTIDSDADPSTGRTPLLEIGSGEYNLTLDVGIVKQPTMLDETDEPTVVQTIYLPLISR